MCPLNAWQLSQMAIAAQLRQLEFHVLEEVPISTGRIDVLAHKRMGKEHVLIICEVKDYHTFGRSQELAATSQMLKYALHLAETGSGYRPTANTRIYAIIVTTSESTIWQKELTHLIDREEYEEISRKVLQFRSFIVAKRRFKPLLRQLGLTQKTSTLDKWVRQKD